MRLRRRVIRRGFFPRRAVVLVAMAAALPFSIRAFSQADGETGVASGPAAGAKGGVNDDGTAAAGRRPCCEPWKANGFDASNAHTGWISAIRDWNSGCVAFSGVCHAGQHQRGDQVRGFAPRPVPGCQRTACSLQYAAHQWRWRRIPGSSGCLMAGRRRASDAFDELLSRGPERRNSRSRYGQRHQFVHPARQRRCEGLPLRHKLHLQ